MQCYYGQDAGYLKGQSTMVKLTKQKGIELGYHRNNVADLIKRGAVVIDDVVYAPVKRRKRENNHS